MLAKYEALAEAAELASGERGPGYRRCLTAIASRWPGALREGELVGPDRVTERRAAAVRGLTAPERPRGQWRDASARAVLLWAELHATIADLLEFRRCSSYSTEAFAAWVVSTKARERWPAPEHMLELFGPRLRVRSAYLCLATRAGSSLSGLDAMLFERGP